MSPWKIAAFVSFSLAVIVAGIGLAATAQLIKEYGENVSPFNLAAQAAVVWVPLACILAAVGYFCFRKVPRQ